MVSVQSADLRDIARRLGPRRFVASLTPSEVEALPYWWRELWARPTQLPPPGDWLTWLVLAGRGWGKSRTGAEFIRDEAQHTPRIALVGRTPADVRDVMIEGESGILRCSPPNFMPTYEPSKRRLTWPNGATGTTFTSYEPDQLRGPQFGAAWWDELCLVGDTCIATTDGDQQLKNIRPGDYVLTRTGPRRVQAAWCSGFAAVYELRTAAGGHLIGTALHPIYTADRGFVPLLSLRAGDILETCVKQSRASSGAASDGGSTAAISWTAEGACYTEQSIPQSTAEYLRGLKFITRIITNSIMPQRILRQLRGGRTYSHIAHAGGWHHRLDDAFKKPLLDGNIANRGKQFAGNVVDVLLRAQLAHTFAEEYVRAPSIGKLIVSQKQLCVGNAENSSSGYASQKGNSVPELAPHGQRIGGAFIKVGGILKRALFAGFFSRQKTLERPRAPSRVNTSSQSIKPRVVSVRLLNEHQLVYNIEVEGNHEYFANGILTHNCAFKYLRETWDNGQLALRLGDHPRQIVTTTPKPLTLLKELLAAKSTVTTRGTTYENRENLAPSFFSKIVSRYQGTMLGRQELEAELLDELEGALWKRSFIHRADPPQAYRRVVIGVDPASTSGEDSDETGIIAAGISPDRKGYVLGDYSCRLSPDGWAGRVVKSFQTHRANMVVAEQNQGGEMVRHTIHTVNPDIPVKLIHAKSAKQVRAEPIAALYEQGKVFHLSTFSDLEDQICSWSPDSGASPDRMDALVYALTELMLGGSAKVWV